MDGADFCKTVFNHPTLSFGAGPRADRIYLIFAGPDLAKVGWEIEPAEILANSWETLEAVFTGKRRPKVMSHIARIVGYYSNMRNWNRSKVAELCDRHAGDYVLPGALADDHAGETAASKRAHRKALSA